MYPRLAAQIQEQLPTLLDHYDEQLRLVPGYSSLPEPARHGLEQQVLQLMTSCLESGDDSALIQYIGDRAEQVLARGFQPEWFQQAITVAEGIVTPLIKTLDEGTFVWRAMNRAQTAAWQVVARERQRVELTLRESEARYQTIFNSTPIMFWLKDTHNRTLRINRAAAAFEGVKPEDVEGQSGYDVYPHEQAEAFYQDDLAVISSGQPKLGIIEQHTATGTGKLTWMETGKTPVHNEQGETIGVLAFGVDITERMQAEEALRHSAESQQRAARYLRATVEATDEIMRAPDLDTVYRRTVELAREKFDIERCGLYLIDESLQSMNGTFGTDDQRHTTDERGVRRPASEFEDLLAASPDQLWIVRETTQIYFEGEVEHAVGTGWAAATILRGASGPIAVLFNDSALSGQPVDKTQQEALAVYCAAVGSIIERKRAEEERQAAFENERISSERFRAVVIASDELIRTTDLDLLYRRAVELAREKLGVERCALYVLDESREWVLGTYGTDAAGRTTDERSHKEPAQNHQVITMPREQQWVAFQTELKDWEGAQNQVVGADWNVATAIRSAAGPIGIMFNDAAISHKPYDEGLQQSLALYCSMLANIIENKRLEMQIRQSLQQRGIQVQTSTEVAQEIASATDLDELFKRVVTLIKERFDYYHAQIFRYDPAQDAVVLVAGYGAVGNTMLEAGHTLPMGRGVVGTAAATGKSMLATDVRQAKDWRPNSNLPETHGELAVPIKLRDQVLGILDVQSDQAGALRDDDRLLLEGLCGQIAIAIESTRLLDTVQQSEQLMRTLIDAIPDSIYAKDLQGRSILANAAEAQLHGLSSPADMAGKSDFDFYPLKLAEQYSASEQAILRDGQALIGHEEPNIDAAGRQKWNSTTKVPLRDQTGNIIGLVGITSDITRRREIELELVRSAQLLRTIVDNSRDLIYIKNRQSEFLLASQALAQLVGAKTPDELIGKTDFDFFPHDMAEKFYRDDQNIIQSGQPVLGLEEPGQTADGQPTWLSTTKIPFLNHNGEIEGIVGIGRDITERKRAEAELAHSAQMLTTIVNNSYDMIYVKDTHSRFLVASQAVADGFGVKAVDDILGKSDFDFHPQEIAQQFYNDEQQLLQSGQPLIDHEEAVIRPDGSPAWLMTTKVPFRASDGTLMGLVGIGRDITERKRAEQQMEETLRETERLYAAVSAEGWKTYRQSGQLPQGYRFDRALLEPAGQLWEPEMAQAVSEEKTIATHDAERAVAVSPLAVHGAIIGALGIYGSPDQPLSPDDMSLMEAASEQVALALESARLFEQTQAARQQAESHLREVQILQHLTQEISGTLDLERVLDALVSTLVDQMHFGFVAFTLIDEPANALRTVRATGLAQGMNGLVRPLDEMQDDIGMDVARKGKIEVIDGWDDRFDREIFEREGHAALVRAFVPLRLREQAVGVLEAGYRRGERSAITPEEIRLLGSLADQVAVVIQNTRLFEQSQARARREQALRELTARVRSSTDPDTVMRTLARELGTVLGRSTFVRLATEQPALTSAHGGNGDQSKTEGGQVT